eukprot:TRINITY_DN2161_c0_g1_i1.p1 TRINITY_DN2161_c0_g1~~TRINITY_DN2161_c0_g1_i1.p1  ORF type:complete len:568 (+),score=122.71 TRINITY_DN2161_c0_g1_i1:109-1812(+)
MRGLPRTAAAAAALHPSLAAFDLLVTPRLAPRAALTPPKLAAYAAAASPLRVPVFLGAAPHPAGAQVDDADDADDGDDDAGDLMPWQHVAAVVVRERRRGKGASTVWARSAEDAVALLDALACGGAPATEEAVYVLLAVVVEALRERGRSRAGGMTLDLCAGALHALATLRPKVHTDAAVALVAHAAGLGAASPPAAADAAAHAQVVGALSRMPTVVAALPAGVPAQLTAVYAAALRAVVEGGAGAPSGALLAESLHGVATLRRSSDAAVGHVAGLLRAARDIKPRDVPRVLHGLWRCGCSGIGVEQHVLSLLLPAAGAPPAPKAAVVAALDALAGRPGQPQHTGLVRRLLLRLAAAPDVLSTADVAVAARAALWTLRAGARRAHRERLQGALEVMLRSLEAGGCLPGAPAEHEAAGTVLAACAEIPVASRWGTAAAARLHLTHVRAEDVPGVQQYVRRWCRDGAEASGFAVPDGTLRALGVASGAAPVAAGDGSKSQRPLAPFTLTPIDFTAPFAAAGEGKQVGGSRVKKKPPRHAVDFVARQKSKQRRRAEWERQEAARRRRESE